MVNADSHIRMKIKPVKHVGFRIATNPKIIEIANELAKFEDRKPLDAIRQLILLYGPIRIQDLQKQKNVSQSAEPTDI
jgi:hypothetical protein